MNTPLKQMSYEDARNELAFCNSYTRLPALLEIHWRLADNDYLRLLGEEWAGFDNIGHYADALWETAFGWWSNDGPLLEMMTPDERDAYDALPDVVTVYRGCYKINKWGLSWSLSKETAENFPSLLRYQRVGDQPLPDTWQAIEAVMQTPILSRNEADLIHSFRHISGNSDAKATVVDFEDELAIVAA
ncbi:MAG: hypothetical protein WA049_14585 [Ferribacterium limneticum]